jgi:hypothetical protein
MQLALPTMTCSSYCEFLNSARSFDFFCLDTDRWKHKFDFRSREDYFKVKSSHINFVNMELSLNAAVSISVDKGDRDSLRNALQTDKLDTLRRLHCLHFS